ncbi:tRNA uridine-5-carboxymethylaminomethyl(34) synthesis GTPase MnmE [Devosia sp.]|uniref:tRNA uridine-5-carboxymethylaminomethyl(34) synthesis GTPase MnmE n=1 Tax=Devosia sp. TaxID=1871048 RepID=UPI003A95AFA0
MSAGDTIVALSSGAVPSGVAVIRLSGALTSELVIDLTGSLQEPRRLRLSRIGLNGETVDTGLVAWMPGPQSFTGEDCAELQVHGSPAVVRALLRGLAARKGVRLAEAGEFTRRAFENGKLDLVEAQGLGDLIVAETENQRVMAHARLDGGLTRRIVNWRERLLDLRADIEAQLDFSDESDVTELDAGFGDAVAGLRRDIAEVLKHQNEGRIVRTGYRVVLAGPPNAGKSSLLNALSRSDVAIVSDEPGTTRDIKEVPLDLDGQLVILIDSAGLRETESKAEALGIDRARDAIASADLVLWLRAADQERGPEDTELSPKQRHLVIGTKADIGQVSGDLVVSTVTGDGIDALISELKAASGAGTVRAGDVLVSHEQDRIALQAALEELDRVGPLLDAPELAAEGLRRAGASLERLLGKMDAESVLDHLFANFCIGK